jgi:hypothetical protein
MLPPLEVAEICVAVPIGLCLLAPLGCICGGMLMTGLLLTVPFCLLLPVACCIPCAMCCCPQALQTSGDETGPTMFRMTVDDGEVFIVNSTVFQTADARRDFASGAQRRSGVVITELPPDELLPPPPPDDAATAAAAAGKEKAA